MNHQRPNSPLGERHQAIPVRLYEDGDRIMLATPMPGLQPDNISVTINGNHVTVHGEQRGPKENETNVANVLMDEWTVGPYHREVDLPQAVNGQGTNATYGNGVLVLAMPKAKGGQQASNVEIKLDFTDSARGMYQGRMGAGQSAVTE